MGIKFEDRQQMGQRYAKHQMQSGVRLYHNRHYQQAIERWRSSLQRLRSSEDRFITLGYIAQAFCDAGDYESMLHYALQQMELANARRDDFMKSEAFLNLSKAYERLADFAKAINYARESLQHPNIDSRTPGYAHSVIAMSHLGFSQFQASLEAFEKAMCIANNTGDKLLELQICVGLGALFTLLRDLNKSLIFLRNALSILQLITVDNVHAKYKSTILLHLSIVLRRKGSLADAHEACDEALRLAEKTGNRSIYARCLCSLADINRELGESEAKETITKSWARYEQSFRMMREINDRMGEVIVLGSMAKSASESRSHYTGQCECQAIQLNKKCLELSKIIGCKHSMLKCHMRLQELYNQLSDEDSEELANKACVALIQEMELFCNFCGQRYGIKEDSLQALRCSHIFHEKCLRRFLSEGDNKSCPKCKGKAILMENLSGHTSAAEDSVNIDYSNKFQRDSLPFSEDYENLQTIVPSLAVSDALLKSKLNRSNRLSITDNEIPSCSKYPQPQQQNHTSNIRIKSKIKNFEHYPFTSVDHLPITRQDETISTTTRYNNINRVNVKQPHYSSQIIVSSKPISILTMKSADQQLILSSSTTSISYANAFDQSPLPTSLKTPIIHESASKTVRSSGANFKRGNLDEEFNESDQIIPSKFNATVSKTTIENSKEFANKCIRRTSTTNSSPKIPPKVLPKPQRPNCNVDSFPPLPPDLLMNDSKPSKFKYQSLISPVAEEGSSAFSSSLDPLDDETILTNGPNPTIETENRINIGDDVNFVIYRGPGVTDL